MLFSALLLEVIWILAADGGQHWTYEAPPFWISSCLEFHIYGS
uniref:Carbonic anhydrase 14 n=2 Tax=Hominidae TaxID=9604 RepID=U3KQH0_HUMAN